ncbi:hypothetical protein BS333_18130 [Vibrio azureus]|uniref:Lipoprotein n=1 Tax=Vibrio azureus NBRC 104587 TaxID=1219077 RepID=U3ABW8_9VIBR|nr:hypothetical protein [Vibrio azureus]AUI88262.1 hypothetical protein BS333_18130 [Vibrio azureus]GAD77416.1 hypothetical protein VAZ01S_075_00100 [Vibrio azureus NBRC 104587]
MKQIAFSLFIFLLVGCSGKPNEQQQNQWSYGSTVAEHTITLKYSNSKSPSQFQSYKITFNLEEDAPTFSFDLCNDLNEEASCPSTFSLKPYNDTSAFLNYSLYFPSGVNNKDSSPNEQYAFGMRGGNSLLVEYSNVSGSTYLSYHRLNKGPVLLLALTDEGSDIPYMTLEIVSNLLP